MPAKKRKPDDELDLTGEQVHEIVRLLEEAAAMLPPGADTVEYRELLAAGRLGLAWEALRFTSEQHAMPFAFWTVMSKAADAME